MKASPMRSAMYTATVTIVICLLQLVAPALCSSHLISSSEREGLEFLNQHMPENDRQLLDHGFMVRNVQYAVKARELTPWGPSVPWSLFLNDVLPYAVLNEQRDDWREFFFDSLSPLVVETTSIEQAASVINARIWKLWNLTFVGGQTPQTMSPFQVLQARNASCTGFSILLVDALRSVGVPARVAGSYYPLIGVSIRASWSRFQDDPGMIKGKLCSVRFLNRDINAPAREQLPLLSKGSSRATETDPLIFKWQALMTCLPDKTPEWNDGSGGNHDWVEIWFDQSWHFIDAFDGTKFDEGWFVPSPVKYQLPNSGNHSIYASSFQPTTGDVYFPLAWDFEDFSVPGLDVTQWYLDSIHQQAVYDHEKVNSRDEVAGHLVLSL